MILIPHFHNKDKRAQLYIFDKSDKLAYIYYILKALRKKIKALHMEEIFLNL